MFEIVFLLKIMKCEKRIEKQTEKNIQIIIIDEKSIEKNEMKKSSNNKIAKTRKF